MVVDELEDHPGRRKSSGFLQPMKHLSGTVKNVNFYNFFEILNALTVLLCIAQQKK